MKSALTALNRLVEHGVVKGYAIGGAIGASFYIEAVQTEDIDAFVFLPVSPTGLISLAPIYDALKTLGGEVEGEHIRFGAWPLQILSDANPLIAEAIQEAISVDYAGVSARVFRPEHLCAIALQTGRSKDYLRVTMFLEQDGVDRRALRALLERHGLTDKLAGFGL
jgi:hypothetical protein